MKIQLMNHSSQKVPRAFLSRFLAFVVKALKRQGFGPQISRKELVVVFVNRPQARQLNGQFRQKDYATDVLSFESTDPIQVGELVLCSEVVKEQSLSHGLSFREEAAYLVLHGLLHLLGFDHEEANQARRMYSLQDKLFEQGIRRAKLSNK